MAFFFFFNFLLLLFIWLLKGYFNCSMWGLVPGPGIEPRPPALGAQRLSHWATGGSLNGIFHRNIKNNPNIYMELHKTSKSQSNLEKDYI